jgi:hypothetical protein
MKMARAFPYRSLVPTLGLSKAVLWVRSLSCQVRLEEDGLTLRHYGKVPWNSITKIGISRNYLDGHLCEIRIHHRNGVSKISVRDLRDGEKIVRATLTMFGRTRRAVQNTDLPEVEPTADNTALAGNGDSPTKDMSGRLNRITQPSNSIATAA